MKRRAWLSAVALAVSSPVLAYVRTTASGTGVPLAWPEPVVPWELNRDWSNAAPSCQAGQGGDPTLDAAKAAFGQWSESGANLNLLYAGETSERAIGLRSDGQSAVLFRSGWCSQDPRIVDPVTLRVLDPCIDDPDLSCVALYGCFQDPSSCIGHTAAAPCAAWGVVALTTVLYDPPSGRIATADVEIIGWDGTSDSLVGLPQHGWYFTCFPGPQPATKCTSYGEGSCYYQDLQNALTHEAGHFIGLAHPCGEGTLPACSADPKVAPVMSPTTFLGDTSKRTLKADDVAGARAIYPKAGGCGCGGGAGTGAASLLAALALRPAFRRRQMRANRARGERAHKGAAVG